MTQITLMTIPNFPHVQKDEDLGELLLEALSAAEIVLQDGDVIALAQKIVSKSEGRHVVLESVRPSARALALGAEIEKDPRLVELILQESTDISRQRKGVLIVRHRLGFTSANAGIDRSNVAQGGEGETVLLLPVDPDESAEKLRQFVGERLGVKVGVVITDSHGRPFRIGTTGVAIGVAGIPAVVDKRGHHDLYGYELRVTEIGLGDEIAAAASLLMGQADEGVPAVIVRGLQLPKAEGKATDLVRPKAFDLYA